MLATAGNPDAVKRAFIVKEVLDSPLGLRQNT
jgi:hypothetical protein